MDTINVLIKELPEQGWLKDWLPLLTAFLALLISFYSAYLSRKEQVRASRPFVWAMNFATLDDKNNAIEQPQTFAYKILNAPAIINTSIKVFAISSNGDNTKDLHFHKEENQVKYPNESVQYTYAIPDFDKLIIDANNYETIVRIINISYKSLAGGNDYTYEIRSKYNHKQKRWLDTYNEAT